MRSAMIGRSKKKLASKILINKLNKLKKIYKRKVI